ncbi:RNA polymerase sigma factor [Streptomyces sp. NPDC056785]|uniref:RNA polymerase sigma factor n=1 Tax=Streptomyces sp. NPDC056785 TaxID=3345944 RepID=UPI00369BBA9E
MSTQANPKISARGGAEPELITRARNGDRDAFATLYNDYQRVVYRFLFFRVRNRELAEDLTQETFVRALRRIETFSDRPRTGGFPGWLVTIARNLHTDHCKASRTRLEIPLSSLVDFEADEFLESAESDALREMEAVEATETVKAGMEGLTQRQQECVRLRFLHDFTIPETAAVMDLNVGAVKTLQWRALRSMGRVLSTDGAAA